MTLSTLTQRIEYTGTGALATFPYPFKILEDSDLQVYVGGSLKVLNTHYTVTGEGVATGGNVVFEAAYIPTLAEEIVILRAMPQTQETDLAEGSKLPAETLEETLDRAVMLAQDLKERLDRAPVLTPSSLLGPIGLPVSADGYLRWNPAGTGLLSVAGSPSPLAGQAPPWVDARDYASLSAAIDAIGATQATLMVCTVQAVAASKTVPTNVSLLILDAGQIQVATGQTLTINGPLQAGLHQIFDYVGTGKVQFGDGYVPEIYPQWWGATADGVTDDTDALQQAINAGADKTMRLPVGTYNYTTLTIASPITIIGDGRTTVLYTTNTSGGITITTNYSVFIEKLTMSSPGAQVGGAFIKVEPAAGHNTFSTFRDLYIVNHLVGIKFVKAAQWTINNCSLETGTANAISVYVENSNSVDEGDAVISNTVFYFNNDTGVAIKQVSASGLRVENNKFLFGKYHYFLEAANGATLSDFFFIGNSSEHAKDANLIFTSGGGGAAFINIVIEDNEFTVGKSVLPGGIGILVNDNGTTWVDGLLIGGNIFGSNVAGEAMDISDSANVSIQNNLYRMSAGSSGIVLAANTSGVDIAPQTYNGITTSISGAIYTSGVSFISTIGAVVNLAAAAAVTIALSKSITNGVALITLGGDVTTVGVVMGLYVASATGVTTVSAIANIAVTSTGTGITITNNTGQAFSGKVLIIY